MLNKNQITLKKNLETNLNVMKQEIAKALPKHMSPERFSRVVVTAATKTPELLECDPTSLFSCLLLGAQLGLEPNGPDQKAFLIPYKKTCSFQLGYRGMLELARRSGEIASIHAEVVYEKDTFELTLGLDPNLVHKPNLTETDRGAVVLAYSVAKLKDGSVDFIWMKRSDIDKARKANKGKSPAWETWFDEMAKKTVMKRHLKTLPMSIEVQDAINTDETVRTEIQEDMLETEGHTVEEVDQQIEAEAESNKATVEERDNFYKYCSDKGLTKFITTQEKTDIAQGCDKQFLRELMSEILPGRAEDAKVKAAEEVQHPDDTQEAPAEDDDDDKPL